MEFQEIPQEPNVFQVYYPGCPLCSSEYSLLGTADCTRHALWHEPLPKALEWMRCTQCGHVHTRHYWSEAGLAEVFRNAHATQLAGMTDSPDAKRATWAPVVERVIGLLGGGLSPSFWRWQGPNLGGRRLRRWCIEHDGSGFWLLRHRPGCSR